MVPILCSTGRRLAWAQFSLRIHPRPTPWHKPLTALWHRSQESILAPLYSYGSVHSFFYSVIRYWRQRFMKSWHSCFILIIVSDLISTVDSLTIKFTQQISPYQDTACILYVITTRLLCDLTSFYNNDWWWEKKSKEGKGFASVSLIKKAYYDNSYM